MAIFFPHLLEFGHLTISLNSFSFFLIFLLSSSSWSCVHNTCRETKKKKFGQQQLIPSFIDTISPLTPSSFLLHSAPSLSPESPTPRARSGEENAAASSPRATDRGGTPGIKREHAGESNSSKNEVNILDPNWN